MGDFHGESGITTLAGAMTREVTVSQLFLAESHLGIGGVNYPGENNTSAGTTQQMIHANTLNPKIRDFRDVTVRYLFLVIIIVGSVGNGLSFLVLVRKRLRSNSLYFYLMVLTLADTLVLYVSCLKTWVRALTGFELLHVSSASCKIVMFTLLVGMHMAAWLVVLVTFDRFVSVWFPFRASAICTAKRARAITACLFLSVTIYNLHVFWTIGLYQRDPVPTLRCISRPGDPFMQQPFEYLKLATYSFIPFLAVFVLNLSIIFKITHGSSLLREKHHSLQHDQGQTSLRRIYRGNRQTTNSVRQQKVIYMLLSLSFSWLVLTGPYGLVSVIITAAPNRLSRDSIVLCKTLAFLLLYLNHSINFYLYCITGKKFRHEFSELFGRYIEQWRRRESRRKSLKTAQTRFVGNHEEAMAEMGPRCKLPLENKRIAQQLSSPRMENFPFA